jgi:predicted RNase H-like nuclease (RuvC/YqgF family)
MPAISNSQLWEQNEKLKEEIVELKCLVKWYMKTVYKLKRKLQEVHYEKAVDYDNSKIRA